MLTEIQRGEFIAALNRDCEETLRGVAGARVIATQLDIPDARHDLFEAERAIRRVLDGIRRNQSSPEMPVG